MLSTGWTEGGQYVHRSGAGADERAGGAKNSVCKNDETTDEAIALFESQGMADKVQLFRYRRASCINVYELDGYYDYNYGYMVPDTGYIDCFDLFPYQDGLMLQLPERRDPEQLPVFEERKKLFKALEDSTRWGEKLGITTVGDLNDKICGGDLAELILVQEAMQESRIGRIAEDIAGRKGVKFVMIAGPSSSGKTTFSHRLSIQLKTFGLTPHPIEVDNYFVNREKTPRDADGQLQLREPGRDRYRAVQQGYVRAAGRKAYRAADV